MWDITGASLVNHTSQKNSLFTESQKNRGYDLQEANFGFSWDDFFWRFFLVEVTELFPHDAVGFPKIGVGPYFNGCFLSTIWSLKKNDPLRRPKFSWGVYTLKFPWAWLNFCKTPNKIHPPKASAEEVLFLPDAYEGYHSPPIALQRQGPNGFNETFGWKDQIGKSSEGIFWG